MRSIALTMLVVCVIISAGDAFAYDTLLHLGSEEFVRADGVDIDVPGYSVPSFTYWNSDNLPDLVVGQGSGSNPPGKVRVYLNDGNDTEPNFSDFFYARSGGSDLTCAASGCMGCFPRVVYWDADARKDLLVGQANGTVKIFLNVGTEDAAVFGNGADVLAGFPGAPLDVGYRATPTYLDWDNDGKTDIITGALDGSIRLFRNCGCGQSVPPSFMSSPYAGTPIQADGQDLRVPSDRSSPVVMDLDGDGKKDILTGNTNGQLLFYKNIGTDYTPVFSPCSYIESNGTKIDLSSSRSRPFVCDFNADGYLDVLIGASDGKVHLYKSVPQPSDVDKDYDVDFDDFALFAQRYGQTGCGNCGWADLFDDNEVNMLDLWRLFASWMEGLQ